MPAAIDYSEFLSSFQSPKFKKLWPAQKHVLDLYSAEFAECSDVAIELPTGGGKTLIALLIAENWRRESKKVAILSANKTLARQMLRESQALGMPAVLMEGAGVDIPASDKRAYQRANRTAIMNYWVYFNQHPVIDPADLIIMDDAHLAEHCLHSLYSVEISKHRDEDLFKTLIVELLNRFPEYSVLNDALADDLPGTCPTELLSFIDQVDIADRFREICDSSTCLNTNTDLRFRWERIRNRLREANIYISPSSIWIRPYIYPLISNAHYEGAQQRLYMSATIGDSNDLSRRLGVKDILKIPVPSDYSEMTFGRRLVVMNRIEEKDIPVRLQAVILAALRIYPKSLWLCSSDTEAAKFQNVVTQWLNSNGIVGHPTWVLTSLGDEIDQFRASPQGHLFVAGRFDGMDFSADECRLVVITTLPRSINSQEDFISAYLRDSGFMKRRLNQRIVQALGRCNRSDDDFAVYILADRRFATHFGPESNRTGLPQNIIAEIDMAQDLAEVPKEELVEIVEHFLHGDFGEYDEKLEFYRANLPPERPLPVLPNTSADEVLGWTALFASQNYEIAQRCFKECWRVALRANLIEMGAFQCWQWAKALYLLSLLGEPAAKEKALRAFEAAISRGGQSAWFNRMRASLNRARRGIDVQQNITALDYGATVIGIFDELLEKVGSSGDRFQKWSDIITADLQSEIHDKYGEGLEKLGQALGYRASRPKYGAATDCRWRGVFGNVKEVITFEDKIEHGESQQIVAHDIGQALIQRTRADGEYGPKGYTVRGTIITHLTSVESSAEASAGDIKVLQKAAIFELWNRLKTLISLYRDNWSLDDIPARLSAAHTIQARLPATGWLIRALDTNGRFIDASHLLAEWP
jgi:hypothetical protein